VHPERLLAAGLVHGGLQLLPPAEAAAPRAGARPRVFITAVPLIKLFAWGQGESGGHVHATRDDEPRPVCTRLPITH
jgi:hypothetical protein